MCQSRRAKCNFEVIDAAAMKQSCNAPQCHCRTIPCHISGAEGKRGCTDGIHDELFCLLRYHDKKRTACASTVTRLHTSIWAAVATCSPSTSLSLYNGR